MAAIAAVVVALARSGWRSLRGTGSFLGNNLFAVIALMMAEEPRDRPSSTAAIYLLVGLLWTLPLAREMTRRIPAARLRLWPLKAWQKAAIAAINMLINPLFAIAVVFGAVSRDRLLGRGLLIAGAIAPFAVLAGRGVRLPPLLKWIPRGPGRLGGLMQSRVRELVQSLDFYFALLTAAGGLIYCRFGARPDPEARVVFGILTVLLMSTLAQGHSSFDAPALETRLRLLPVSGAQILLARDAAWAVVVTPMILGFRVGPCFGAALGALIAGHSTSRGEAMGQKRWSFATGRLVPQGVTQVICLVAAGVSVLRWGWPALAVSAAVYGISVWRSGRTTLA